MSETFTTRVYWLKRKFQDLWHICALQRWGTPGGATSEAHGVKGHDCDSADSSESLSQPPNSQKAERLASLDTPTGLPRILAGSRGTEGSGPPLPWTNIEEVVGHWKSSRKAFIPEKLISGECVCFSIHTGVLGQHRVATLKHGLPDISALLRYFVVCILLFDVFVRVSHVCWRPLWEDDHWLDAHTHKQFVLQSKHVPKLYQISWFSRPRFKNKVVVFLADLTKRCRSELRLRCT